MNAQPSRLPRGVAARRPAARAVALTAPVIACAVGLIGPASAVTLHDAPTAAAEASRAGVMAADLAGSTMRPVVPVAESWYRPLSALCSTPVGCPPAEPPPGYPDGTLHVGALGGAPDSTTYIALPLPASGLLGGTLRLPVGPAEDGTLQPESAKVKACVVTGNVKDKVAGSWSTRPGVDCSSSSPAVASGDGSVLTVDLAPFLTEWDGEPVGALALQPADTPAATDVWHLAFSRHDRPGATAQPLSASLLVEAGTTPPVDLPEDNGSGTGEVPSAPEVAEPPALEPGALPEIVPTAPTVDSPPVVSVPKTSLRPVASFWPDTSFAYPGVFLLPPLVLLAAGWAARAFTRDLADEQR